jgi:hypothetical protein
VVHALFVLEGSIAPSHRYFSAVACENQRITFIVLHMTVCSKRIIARVYLYDTTAAEAPCSALRAVAGFGWVCYNMQSRGLLLAGGIVLPARFYAIKPTAENEE